MHSNFLWENQIPVLVLPIEVTFNDNDEAGFRAEVQGFLEGFKS